MGMLDCVKCFTIFGWTLGTWTMDELSEVEKNEL
jgi:hypothetical protein